MTAAIRGIVEDVSVAGVSKLGNVSRYIDLDVSGVVVRVKTPTNSSWSYVAANLHRGELVTVRQADSGRMLSIEHADPWAPIDARVLTRQARYLLSNHGAQHDEATDEVVRENCGACVLAGFGATDDGPNYAGWERIYAQSYEPVPAPWRAAFFAALDHENRCYADAFARDLATFGVSW